MLVRAKLRGILCACALTASVTAFAQEVLTLDEAAHYLRLPPAKVAELAREGRIPARQVGSDWRFSKDALAEWLRGDVGNVRGRGAPAGAEAAAVAQASPAPTVGEKRETPTAEEVALRDQGALLKGGAKSLELGLFYAHSEQENFPVLRSEDRALGVAVTGRYGIKDNLQVTARLPWIYRHNSSEAALPGQPSQATTATDRYAADMTLSLLGVAFREASGRPNLLWTLDSVLPTGPGDRGLGVGLIVSKSYDPVVLFASVGYLRGFEVNDSDSQRALGRNNWRWSLGYTYAVNDNLALNSVFAGTYTSERETADSLPGPRERNLLQFGMTWLLRRGLYVEPAVGIGVGGSAPDFTFSLNVPYTF
jgi:excisionase family DNA binding protein